MFQSILNLLCNVFFASITFLCVRIFIVVLRIRSKRSSKLNLKYSNVKIMTVMGSGGHTYEMLGMMKNISKKFYPRIYIVAETDKLSEQKVTSFEESKLNSLSEAVFIEKIPRSREVGQSWISTIFTTLKSCYTALVLVWQHQPDILLCNGPGTCVPVCLAVILFHVLGLKRTRIIYIESICRVHTMSLTGKILHGIADGFLVQWPHLSAQYPLSKYIGKLI